MDEENLPPVPNNIISLKNAGRTELTLNRTETAPTTSSILLDNFGYVYGDGKNTIVAYDLLVGTETVLKPKISNDRLSICSYHSLPNNHGLIVYMIDTSTKTTTNSAQQYVYKYESLQMSVISIDFDAGTYDFVGKSYTLPLIKHVNFKINFSKDMILLKCRPYTPEFFGWQLQVFKLNGSTVSHQQTVNIDFNDEWFTLIDGKIVFARILVRVDKGQKVVESFMFVDENNSVTKIKNTGACLKSHNFNLSGDFGDEYVNDINGNWNGTKCFVFYKIKKFVYSEDVFFNSTLPFLWVFELETKQWSEIRLDFSFDKYSYKLAVDCNGVLNVLGYSRIAEEKEKNGFVEYVVDLTRIPLRKPDELLKLCWFQACKNKLANNMGDLKNFI